MHWRIPVGALAATDGVVTLVRQRDVATLAAERRARRWPGLAHAVGCRQAASLASYG